MPSFNLSAATMRGGFSKMQPTSSLYARLDPGDICEDLYTYICGCHGENKCFPTTGVGH